MSVLKVCLLIAGALACDQQCLDNCFCSNSEADCLSLCGCSSLPHSIAHFGGNVTTEGGTVFSIQHIPESERQYVSEVYDCKLKCGELCFRFTNGWNLIKCVEFCGCGMFVSEITNSGIHRVSALQTDSALVVPESSDCISACISACTDEYCKSQCKAEICTPELPRIFLIFLGPVLIVPCVFLLRNTRKYVPSSNSFS